MKHLLPEEIVKIIESFIITKCIMCNTIQNIFTLQPWGHGYCCSSCVHNLELLMM